MTQTLTADQHRAAAARAHQDAADSFERCDTDGFLSQWASGLTARKHEAEAELIENGGMVETAALFDLDGNVISTHHGYTRNQWGRESEWWRTPDGRFLTPSRAQTWQARERNNKAKGFTIGTVKVRGYVTIAGGGQGLGGAASCYVATFPVIDDLREGRYEIVCTDIYTDPSTADTRAADALVW